jgi:endo-1,4-beta-xylanase
LSVHRTIILLTVLAVCAAGPAEAARAADPGFIRQFLVVGNWAKVPAKRRLIAAGDLPFEGRVTLGKLWTVLDAREDGFVDLNTLGPVSLETALAHVYVRSDKASACQLVLGVDNQATVILNGKQVFRSKRNASWDPGRETVSLKLAKGWNRLLFRVESNEATFGFSARFTLPDGRPVTLETQPQIPSQWLARSQLKRPLSKEDVTNLLEVMDSRINSAAWSASRRLRRWQSEGEALDPAYARARTNAARYVETLRTVLETLPAAANPQKEIARRQKAEAARRTLMDAALGGPYRLADRTRTFAERAHRGKRLWDMVRLAATTAYEAGQQAAEVDRALVEARALLAAVESRYLRPYLLRERTLATRTAPMVLRLVSRDDGAPLGGSEVTVEQFDHEFLFGCNLFAWGRFDEPAAEDRYREQFVRLFNLAAVPMYWSLIEPLKGKINTARDSRGLPGPEPIIAWCRSRRLKVMATPILSDEAAPAWLRGEPEAERAGHAERAVRELAARFKGRVDIWDVAAGSWPSVVAGRLRLPVADVFKWLADADPDSRRILSDDHAHTLTVAARQQRRQAFGLSAVSLTAWQADGAQPDEDLESQLDRLQREGLAVHVGRVMIPGSANDEALQARQVEAFYRTAFAHPAVRSITWWDLSDRFARRGKPAGLLRADLSPKPAYDTLARLILNQWHTHAEGQADAGGRFAFRGYFGLYRVEATLPDGTPAVWHVRLTSDGPRDVDVVYPPEEPGGDGD